MADILQEQVTATRAVRRGAAALQLRRLAAITLPSIVFYICLIALWETMARVIASPLVPNVAEIAEEVRRLVVGGFAARQIGITLGRILAGFGVAFVISLIVGIAASRSAVFRRFCDPAIILGLTVPGLVWALLCVIWFGVSLTTPVVSIALGITPVMILHVRQGMNAVDAEIVEMAHVFKLSTRDKLQHIWIPSLTPHLIGGGRVGLSLAWKVIVLVELFGLSNGVGYQLNSEFSSQNVAGVLAWTIVFWAVMVALEYGVLQSLERRLSRWRRVSEL
ncbi:ABC transporter permease subunit [Bradyrhizobium sp. Arg237L]|uniref:ABC transporter permease n=1 Tax=Bradyrhizobium sp. Arg237L TaxID=3003352 RepID=UPI00249F26B8|nr:ABC transporter permease subunit [Bradyrhizobium sp. Arg237L]MDI4238309.1 ABC transporter permease subunit [Bradyrhizobium sp. Arg237L]